MSQLVPVALIGTTTDRNGTAVLSAEKDQHYRNILVEVDKNPVTDTGTAYASIRPGFKIGVNAGADFLGSTGCTQYQGTTLGTLPMLTWIDSAANLKTMSAGGSVIGGLVSGIQPAVGGDRHVAAPRLSQTTNSGTAILLLMVRMPPTVGLFGKYQLYTCTDISGTWTAMASANCPTNVAGLSATGHAVDIDGFTFVATDDGRIWNSNQNDVLTWQANSYTTAQSSPDGLFAIEKVGPLLAAFGGASIDFFQNTGNATGSPLTRVNNATLNIGLFDVTTTGHGACEAILKVGDTVYFVGAPAGSASFKVYQLRGTQAAPVSNPAVDKWIGHNLSAFTGFTGVMSLNGQTHLILSVVGGGTAWCYTVETGLWWEFDLEGNVPAAALSFDGVSYMSVSDGRSVFYQDPSAVVYVDDEEYPAGTVTRALEFTAEIRTRKLDFGSSDLKTQAAAVIVGDVCPGCITRLYWSDDDYATWHAYRAIDQSVTPPRVPKTTAMGSFYQRAYRIRPTGGVFWRAERLDCLINK